MQKRTLLIPVLLFALGCKTETTEEYSIKFSKGAHLETSVLDSRLERLERLAREYPRRSDLPYQMAGVHYQKESYRESARSLERAIAIDPHEAKYHYHLGRIYMKMRELEPAEKAFRRSIELMPSNRYTGGRAALGYLLCQKGDWEGARAEFESCARVNPGDPTPSYFLGCIEDARKRPEEAVAHLKDYLERGGVSYRQKAVGILASYGVEAPPPPATPGLRSGSESGSGEGEAAGDPAQWGAPEALPSEVPARIPGETTGS